jgi:NAD(P)-dependent dehydrogenase (short-subunit alcohol dehydrogenase family)
MSRFHGRNVIVTGASSGIGRAIAGAFAREGASVLALARDQARLAALAAEHPAGTVTALAVDIRDTDGLIHALEEDLGRRGRPDVLVNCAGVVFDETIAEISPASWGETLATNLTPADAATARYGDYAHHAASQARAE